MNLMILLFLGVFLYICLVVRGPKKYAAISISCGLLVFAVFLFNGGTRIDDPELQDPGGEEMLHALFLFDGGTRIDRRASEDSGTRRTLRVLARAGGIPSEVYQQLEASTGIAVEETTYANDREFDAIIESDREFDVAFIADYRALRMKRLGQSVSIDYKRVPGAKMISPRISGYRPFRPFFECSVPYLFGTLSIGYNRFHFDDPPLSWGEFFEDAVLKDMRGRVVLNDEMRNMLGLMLKVKGYSPNSTKPEEVRSAGKYMMEIMDASLPYLGQDDELLADETAYVGVAWSSEMAHAMEENPKIRFASAHEGAVVFLECFSIMKSCRDEDAAYEFINYIYQPKVAAKVTNMTYRASVNGAADPYVSPEIFNGPSYFFPEYDAIIVRKDLVEGDAIFHEVWAEVMSHYETVVLPQREEELVLGF